MSVVEPPSPSSLPAPASCPTTTASTSNTQVTSPTTHTPSPSSSALRQQLPPLLATTETTQTPQSTTLSRCPFVTEAWEEAFPSPLLCSRIVYGEEVDWCEDEESAEGNESATVQAVEPNPLMVDRQDMEASPPNPSEQTAATMSEYWHEIGLVTYDPKRHGPNGDTLLLDYAREGLADKVLQLLDERVPVDEQNYFGESALKLASEAGHLEVVELLLSRKANPNIRDIDNERPIHAAAMNGFETIVERLLQHGAFVNVKDCNGDTPLHLAVENAHVLVVCVLLRHAASLSELNNQNVTPVEHALSLYTGSSKTSLFIAELLLGVADPSNQPSLPLPAGTQPSPSPGQAQPPQALTSWPLTECM